ncbi:NADPH-dependent F420 reductase [Natronobeatus ordinarius]|uniref:NADPH-dependent F420 reductase n=1 Tax=Natronobeatus ordinarius TaxID=2963433 RepID=UPI0020CC4ECB|nr:NADPH-dependent F420 reductase [Natronobeatus ordinarius]
MRIALLGGTGDIGEGLALRLARETTHEVVVGSRTAEKAAAAVEAYADRLGDELTADLSDAPNEAAAAGADVVVACVPPYHLSDTVDSVADALSADAILVSPAVGISRDDDGFHYNRPPQGSVAELAADAAPDDVPVVGAFQNLAAGALADLAHELGFDVVVTGDDEAAKETVKGIVEELEGLRPLDGGALANSAEVEAMTPLLINLAMENDGLHDLGVSFH